MPWLTLRRALLIAAVLVFLLAVFHAPVPVDLVPLGLALGFASLL